MRVAFLGCGAWGAAALLGVPAGSCCGAWAWTSRPPRGGLQAAVGLLRRLLPLEMERAAASAGVPLGYVREASDPALLEAVRRSAPDLILVASWPHRIPGSLLSLAPLGGVNVHPSLLPRYRGPHPLREMLAAGDADGGVTLHRMTERYDEGPLLWQGRASLAGAGTEREAEARLLPLASEGVGAALRTLA